MGVAGAVGGRVGVGGVGVVVLEDDGEESGSEVGVSSSR